jgi:group I intron endonuclease
MNVIYSIYLITNINNGKSYVGYTKKQPVIRFKEHCRGNDRFKLPRAIKKHGQESFVVETIYQSKDLFHIRNMENFFIEEYDTITSGYNIAKGGQGGCIALFKENPEYDKIREKLSVAQRKNREVLSERAKSNHMENKIGMYGKKHSDETRHKIGSGRRGKKNTPEHIRKVVEANKKVISAPGYVNPMRGKKMSSESIEKMRENMPDKSGGKNGRAKPMIYNGVTYDCMKSLMEITGIKYHTTRKMIERGEILIINKEELELV